VAVKSATADHASHQKKLTYFVIHNFGFLFPGSSFRLFAGLEEGKKLRGKAISQRPGLVDAPSLAICHGMANYYMRLISSGLQNPQPIKITKI